MMMNSMESAPKDGRYVILFGDSGYRATPLQCCVSRWGMDFRPGRWIDHATDALEFKPTGWMEIPTPDSASATLTEEVVNTIARERLEQIQKHGFTVERDLELYGVTSSGGDDLLRAAVCYIKNPTEIEDRRGGWPWSLGWWKPSCFPRTPSSWTVANRVKELVKAAALIVAHIEMQLRIKQQLDAKRKQINDNLNQPK